MLSRCLFNELDILTSPSFTIKSVSLFVVEVVGYKTLMFGVCVGELMLVLIDVVYEVSGNKFVILKGTYHFGSVVDFIMSLSLILKVALVLSSNFTSKFVSSANIEGFKIDLEL